MRSLLSFPFCYDLLGYLLGGARSRAIFVNEYVKPSANCKILDLGCGTGDIINFLPPVEYLGIDISQRYIKKAIKCYGTRGRFICSRFDQDVIEKGTNFDIVLAVGVVHHLNDTEAKKLFKLASRVLVNGGKLVTFDGCYVKEQSCIAKFLLRKDRGAYVRTQEEYISLATDAFKKIRVSIRNDLLTVPYTHIIMENVA